MVNTIIILSLVIIAISILIILVRFIKGPTSVDRVVAFDSMTIASMSLIGIIAFLSKRVIYFDVAIVYGLLSFLAVIIIAKYSEKSL